MPAQPNGPILTKFSCVVLAVACWTLLAVSVGWYYTATYFGRVGWPLPSIETVGALLLYYFSVLNVATEIQALHWLLVFPVSGLLWSGLIAMDSRRKGNRLAWTTLAAVLGLASLPIALPIPYMMHVAGQTVDGWQFERMIAVALRRGSLTPWAWLTPMYLALGVLSFLLHLLVLWRFLKLPPAKFLQQLALVAIVYVLVIALLGTLLSFPLRTLLE